jgi:hypothetical protein
MVRTNRNRILNTIALCPSITLSMNELSLRFDVSYFCLISQHVSAYLAVIWCTR